MTKKSICFFTETVDFSLRNRANIRKWLTIVGKKENHKIDSLNYIFCSDKFLLKLNQQFLKHDTYTDVITFDHAEIKRQKSKDKNQKRSNSISGEIFISIDRVKDNAKTLGFPFKNELHRVMVHGLLHLIGYSDKTAAKQKLMRAKEDVYLKVY